DRQPGNRVVGLLTDDCPLAGQVSFTAQPLALDQVVFGQILARQAARQVPLPPPALMLLAEFSPNFPFARHGLGAVGGSRAHIRRISPARKPFTTRFATMFYIYFQQYAPMRALRHCLAAPPLQMPIRCACSQLISPNIFLRGRDDRSNRPNCFPANTFQYKFAGSLPIHNMNSMSRQPLTAPRTQWLAAHLSVKHFSPIRLFLLLSERPNPRLRHPAAWPPITLSTLITHHRLGRSRDFH